MGRHDDARGGCCRWCRPITGPWRRPAGARRDAKTPPRLARGPARLQTDPASPSTRCAGGASRTSTTTPRRSCSPIPTTRCARRPGGERQIVARRLLPPGNADLAYKVVQQNALTDGGASSEAEFLCGYIALRFLKKPSLAFDHFAQVLARVDQPVGQGARRLLERPRRRRPGQARSRREMVRRRGGEYGDLLRPAGGAPAGQRRAAASAARAAPERCRASRFRRLDRCVRPRCSPRPATATHTPRCF